MNRKFETNEIPRYLLCLETQFIEWSDDSEWPIVDIADDALVLDEYDTRDEALIAIDNYLARVGASLEWSDVRPIETCACCKGDVDTLKSHKVLTLSTEVGPENDVRALRGDYPARFCTTCVPIKFNEVAA